MLEFQHRSYISIVLDSVTLIQLCSSILLIHLFTPWYGSPFPPPIPNSYCSPIFYPLTPLCSLFAPASPPQIALAQSNHPPGRRPHPPASASRPCAYLTFCPLLDPQVPPGPWIPATRSDECRFHCLCKTPLPPSACAKVPVIP